MNGISNAPDAPHLAGQPAMYIAAQLRAYKTRTRQHEVMAVMAGTLSDDGPSYTQYSWFVGFAPADAPEITISVLLGNAESWWLKAHTAARMVLDRVLTPPRRT